MTDLSDVEEKKRKERVVRKKAGGVEVWECLPWTYLGHTLNIQSITRKGTDRDLQLI